MKNCLLASVLLRVNFRVSSHGLRVHISNVRLCSPSASSLWWCTCIHYRAIWRSKGVILFLYRNVPLCTALHLPFQSCKFFMRHSRYWSRGSRQPRKNILGSTRSGGCCCCFILADIVAFTAALFWLSWCLHVKTRPPVRSCVLRRAFSFHR